jgi:hypothetical protein
LKGLYIDGKTLGEDEEKKRDVGKKVDQNDPYSY